MKREELMINDWVSLDGEPIQVAGLQGRKVGVHKRRRSIYCSWHLDSEFQPIPLTEEILVKNGFKKESQTIDGDYCKYTLPGFALNWCDTDGFWYQNGDITPNHVHQLQHLLRLAGIEKEIEL